MVTKLVVSLVWHAPTCGMAHEVDGRGARSGIKATIPILIPEKGTLCSMLDWILQLNDELGKLGKQSFMQIKYT
uniref:Uncharacterized protein n=1 Tax=Oryza punctata TaxID=4537 RepID=A0A0E0MGW9_ORYPU